MNDRLLREERGFTLIEMMVTIIVMIIMLFALYSIFDMSLIAFSYGNSKEEAMENARLGVEKMEREIRQAYAFDKANGDRRLFQTWTADQIVFGNDLDGNMKSGPTVGECPNAVGDCELISYQVYQPAGSSTYALGRANSGAGTLEPVVEYVDYVSPTNTGVSFRYFDTTGGTTEMFPGDPNERAIDMVRIELRITVDSAAPQPGTQTLTTDVALRNRGN